MTATADARVRTRSRGVAVGLCACLLATLVVGCGHHKAKPKATPAPNIDEPLVTRVAAIDTTLKSVDVRWTKVFDAHSLITGMATRPGDTAIYLSQVLGYVQRVDRVIGPNHRMHLVSTDRTILDLRKEVTVGGENGLLDLAFSPDGTRMYVTFVDKAIHWRLREYKVSPGGIVDLASARDILNLPKPGQNHNGGALRFGPDGFLYASIGDGGDTIYSVGLPQKLDSWFGKIIRIDPLHPTATAPYSVPPSNPFVGRAGALPEIWLYGVRNPFQITFDRQNGDLWIGDVGDNKVEEVDYLPAATGGGRGANLGWDLVEGDRPFRGQITPDLTPPLLTYGHDPHHCAIVGGVLYWGSAVGALRGAYLYGDYCSAAITAIRQVNGKVTAKVDLPSLPTHSLVALQEGPGNEVYAMDVSGFLYRLDPSPTRQADNLASGITSTLPRSVPTLPAVSDVKDVCGFNAVLQAAARLQVLSAAEGSRTMASLIALADRYLQVAPTELQGDIRAIGSALRAIRTEVNDTYNGPAYATIQDQIPRHVGQYGDLLDHLRVIDAYTASHCSATSS